MIVAFESCTGVQLYHLLTRLSANLNDCLSASVHACMYVFLSMYVCIHTYMDALCMDVHMVVQACMYTDSMTCCLKYLTVETIELVTLLN